VFCVDQVAVCSRAGKEAAFRTPEMGWRENDRGRRPQVGRIGLGSGGRGNKIPIFGGLLRGSEEAVQVLVGRPSAEEWAI
jgi:hypothetical protein